MDACEMYRNIISPNPELVNTIFSFYNIISSIDQDQLDRKWKSDRRGKLGDGNLLPSPFSRTNLTGSLHAI